MDLNAILEGIKAAETGSQYKSTAARHEQSYCYGGFYYDGPNGHALRTLSKTWGCLAHCSFSSWQIMYITATELGFSGSPIELMDDEVARPFVAKYIQTRILDNWPRITPEGVADAYNTGRPFDTRLPDPSYVARFMSAYNAACPKDLTT